MKKNIISSVIKRDLCTSCGLCTKSGRARMIMKKGILTPTFQKNLISDESTLLYNICPGKGYPIIKMAQELYNKDDNTIYDFKFGYYRSIGAATSNDTDFLKYSSSGGMIPTIAYFLLEQKLVDGIVTVKFEYENGISVKPFIAKSKEDLIASQGSKYLPVPLLDIFDTILNFKGSLAVIGTPCQIAGIRLCQNQYPELNKIIKYTISNFCGGYRDFRETKRIFAINKVNERSITYFSYRGEGQPGYMTIKQKNKNDIKLGYPNYSKLTGYIKAYRCRTCIDATGELADITFGDAWLKRYLSSGKKWSFYVCRNKSMEDILCQLNNQNKISYESITEDDLYNSQKGNLITKKNRQASRYKLYKYLGKSIPDFDGGYKTNGTNLKLEIKVHLVHNMMYVLEKIRLYTLIRKIIKRK